MAEDAVPHVLLFPFPAQGHVTPMLKLGELLSLAGLNITFLNTEHIHQRLLTSSSLDHLIHRPNFRFRAISDGLSEDNPRTFAKFLDLIESMRIRSRESYKDLLIPTTNYGMNHEWSSSAVTCVIADGVLPLAIELPHEMGIPAMIFRTSSASSVWAYYNIPELLNSGEVPFPDDADLDEAVRGVPGMESILRRRDLPSFIRQAKSDADRTLQFCRTISTNAKRGAALILNTFESIDAVVLPHIRSVVSPVTYALGPLHLLLRNHRSQKSATNDDSSSSLWEVDRGCMEWLDSQPDKSVVYVSFGSITMVSREEVLEFWHGLVSSGKRFLWVGRRDMVDGVRGPMPLEIEEGTRERGCMVEWAPQEEVLAHRAVGCFLTHSGWNSSMESVVAGVPMICWPFFADQMVTSRFVSRVWKIGVDMKDTCERGTVEEMVGVVMDGDGGGELRRSCEEMALRARQCVEVGGSSYKDFETLIQHIRSFQSPDREPAELNSTDC